MEINNEVENTKNEHNIHQVHHYISIYIIVTVTIAFGIYKIYKKTHSSGRKETVVINIPREPSVHNEETD